MSETDMTRYAFGIDMLDDCTCPAVRADVIQLREPNTDTDHPVGEVGWRYDNILRERRDVTEGTVSEDVAAEAWLEALDIASRDDVDAQSLEAGERVARELGWMGADE